MIDAAPLDKDAAGAIETEYEDAVGDGNAPRRFRFGQEYARTASQLGGLERISERLAPRIRAVIEPLARIKTQVAADPLDTQRLEQYRESLPGFTSVSLYRVRPLKGGALMVIEPEFIARLVDSFYGGTGSPNRAKMKELTPTEERILTRVADGIMGQLVDAWADTAPLDPQLALRETNVHYVNLARPEEQVVIQRFVVTPAGAKPSGISIVYPLSGLRPFIAQLSATQQSDDGPPDPDWRGRLGDAVREVRMPVRSVLARPELSLSQLMALKVGDVIPITLAPKVPLIVANRRIAQGTIGEQDGRAALLVEQIEGGTEL
jgi:flagellar motor switch protein FliM